MRPAALAVVLKSALRLRRRVAREKHDLSLWIDPASVFGLQILKTGGYEDSLAAFVCSVLRPGDTFVDVGAHEGYFSLLASRAVGPGRVVAIEPQTRAAAVLRENVRLNAAVNVVVRQMAVSDAAGEILLHLAPDTNTGASSQFPHWKVRLGVQTARATTLDSIASEEGLARIRLIKLDCEGAEYAVLRGARELLRDRRIDLLVVDFHPHIVGENAAQCIDTSLRGTGYRLTRIPSGLWVYHLPESRDALQPLGECSEVPPLAV